MATVNVTKTIKLSVEDVESILREYFQDSFTTPVNIEFNVKESSGGHGQFDNDYSPAHLASVEISGGHDDEVKISKLKK